MAPSPNRSHEDGHSQRRLDQDVRNAIASLTRRLAALGKSVVPPAALSRARGTADRAAPSDRDGVRVITLTGSNKGAAMKVDGTAVGLAEEETRGMLLGDEKLMRAYANSNYQAANNSVVLGGSCTAENPGVHISILDFGKEGDEGGDEEEDQEGS